MTWTDQAKNFIRLDEIPNKQKIFFCFIHRGFKRKIVLLWCMQFTVIKKDYENRFNSILTLCINFVHRYNTLWLHIELVIHFSFCSNFFMLVYKYTKNVRKEEERVLFNTTGDAICFHIVLLYLVYVPWIFFVSICQNRYIMLNIEHSS